MKGKLLENLDRKKKKSPHTKCEPTVGETQELLSSLLTVEMIMDGVQLGLGSKARYGFTNLCCRIWEAEASRTVSPRPP